MATRRDIISAFYTELESAATGTYTVSYSDGSTESLTIDSSDVALQFDGDEEDFPMVVFAASESSVPYNGVGTAASKLVRDSSGNVTEAQHWDVRQAQFTIQILAGNEATKEPIYESIHSAFGKYQFGPWYAESLDADIHDVSVHETSTNDVSDVEATLRGDTLEVRFLFKRVYTYTDDVMDTISTEVDADTDTNTNGLTYTTT